MAIQTAFVEGDPGAKAAKFGHALEQYLAQPSDRLRDPMLYVATGDINTPRLPVRGISFDADGDMMVLEL